MGRDCCCPRPAPRSPDTCTSCWATAAQAFASSRSGSPPRSCAGGAGGDGVAGGRRVSQVGGWGARAATACPPAALPCCRSLRADPQADCMTGRHLPCRLGAAGVAAARPQHPWWHRSRCCSSSWPCPGSSRRPQRRRCRSARSPTCDGRTRCRPRCAGRGLMLPCHVAGARPGSPASHRQCQLLSCRAVISLVRGCLAKTQAHGTKRCGRMGLASCEEGDGGMRSCACSTLGCRLSSSSSRWSGTRQHSWNPMPIPSTSRRPLPTMAWQGCATCSRR